MRILCHRGQQRTGIVLREEDVVASSEDVPRIRHSFLEEFLQIFRPVELDEACRPLRHVKTVARGEFGIVKFSYHICKVRNYFVNLNVFEQARQNDSLALPDGENREYSSMFPISEAGEDDFLPGGENGARSSPFSVEWCGTLCRAGRTTVRRFRSMRVRRELFVTGGQGAVCVKRKTGGVAVFIARFVGRRSMWRRSC